MFEGKKVDKETPKRPLSQEGREALDEAQSFLKGTQKYDRRFGDYAAPMGALLDRTKPAPEVSVNNTSSYVGTKIKPARPIKALGPRTMSDAAKHATHIERSSPDLFE